MKQLPFEGIRVADFGWVITAPLATLWLATLGAEVIKIETKAYPETFRRGTHGGMADGVLGPNRGGGFNSLNYSKYSCCLDLRKPRARELAKEVIKTSDVMVEAFANPVLERYELTYEQVKKVKPDVVMLSVSSLGKTGPLRDATGYGPANQSYAGLPSMTGYEGSLGANIAGTWPDYWVGIVTTYLLTSALYHRRRTGQGVHIDLSMVEAVLNMVPQQVLDYQMNGRVAKPQGNFDPLATPNEVYRCLGEDKWVAITVETEEQWAAFCQATGHQEWREDERFGDLFLRQKHRAELDALVTEWTRERTALEVMETLQAAGVPAGPSQNAEDIIGDPQLWHRGQFMAMDHPEVGERLMMAMQGAFSAIPERRYFPPPMFDQHNYFVFHELLGLPEDEVAQLIEEGVIA